MANEPSSQDCCPEFDPVAWDNKDFKWENKLFVKDKVRSFMYIPLNMGKVVTRMYNQIKGAAAEDKDFILLSKDVSPFKSEQYMPVSKEVNGMENVTISGHFMTRVFEGPYREAKNWIGEMREYVGNKGKTMQELYFYYTTCPKCAKKYGKNYVVAFARIN